MRSHPRALPYHLDSGLLGISRMGRGQANYDFRLQAATYRSAWPPDFYPSHAGKRVDCRIPSQVRGSVFEKLLIEIKRKAPAETGARSGESETLLLYRPAQAADAARGCLSGFGLNFPRLGRLDRAAHVRAGRAASGWRLVWWPHERPFLPAASPVPAGPGHGTRAGSCYALEFAGPLARPARGRPPSPGRSG